MLYKLLRFDIPLEKRYSPASTETAQQAFNRIIATLKLILGIQLLPKNFGNCKNQLKRKSISTSAERRLLKIDESSYQKWYNNTKAFLCDGDLREKQLSPPRPPLVDSQIEMEMEVINENIKGLTLIALDLKLTPKYLCATANVLDTDMKLHPMPSTGTSAQVNTNVSNIQKKRRHSEQPDPLFNIYCK
ncbi:hypothetical protein H5410_053169 [Solanum commersonii]|uniref:Uncharacterized protein n=1 Tax=Solanum commersonii TaxID=4109 RepID=A0A9J5X5N7_SOLCO|nr:hypothetical protein H5410_053169 [Solanum commersonii]